jgi:hypothetical protein
LYRAGEDLRERGGYGGHVSESSVYTKAVLHPLVTSAVAVGCGLLIAVALQARDSRQESAFRR